MTRPYIAPRYFSGVGIMLIGEKDPVTGEPMGLEPLGDTPDLEVTIENKVIDHRESQTSARGIDHQMGSESSAIFTFNLDQWNPEMIAALAYTTADTVPLGAAKTAEVMVYPGKWTPLPHMNITISAVETVDTVPVPLVANTDYVYNETAGSIFIKATSSVVTDPTLIEVTYGHTAQIHAQAMKTAIPPVRWVRWEGLNVAEVGVSPTPVVIEAYKVSLSPLSKLILSSKGESVNSLPVTLTTMFDGTRPPGTSAYWSMKMV